MVEARLGRFEVLSKLGDGAFGEVHRALDHRIGREVALKRLKPMVAADPRVRRRFLQEGKAVGALSHPGIVDLYDVLPLRGGVCLVMELVKGESLAQRLRRGGLGSRHAAELGVKLADALGHAHGHGIIHRDVKPSNVLLGDDGVVKVADFGLARLVGGGDFAWTVAEDPITQEGRLGTVAYMSPEQLRGEVADARSDLFSLCVLLAEAASGRRPFFGGFAAELEAAILLGEPDLAAIEEPLRSILRRGLAKEPAQRYASMAALAHDLRWMVDGTHVVRAERASELVGRAAERQRLVEGFARATAPGGQGSTFVVSGEAGVGKTALLQDFLLALPAARQARETFREGRRGFGPIQRAMSELGALGPLTAVEEATLERPARETVAQALQRLTQLPPFVLVLEDLHEAGADVFRELRQIAGAMSATRGLLLLSYRVEDALGERAPDLRRMVTDLRARGLADEVPLDRLDPDATAAMVASLLAPAAVPDPRLARHVHQESEGNPLFVRETVRWLRATGRLGPGGEVLGGELPSALPGRMRDILRCRLEALDPPLVTLLEVAAVEGPVFHSDVLASVVERPRPEVLRDLRRLVSEHHIVVASGSSYHFTHAKFREVLLEQILPEGLAELHGRVADALQSTHHAGPAEMARHLVAAGRREAALPHVLDAGRHAQATGSTAEAAALYQTAAEILAGGSDRRREADAWQTAAQLGRLAGQAELARKALERLIAIVPEDEGRHARAVHDLGWMDLRKGDVTAARRRFERARRLFQAAGDRMWTAACLDALGVALRHEGDLDGARKSGRRALGLRQRIRFTSGVALSRSNLGVLESLRGHVREALALFEASARHFRRLEAKDPEARERLAVALANVGAASLELGRLDLAREAFDEVHEVRRKLGDRLREWVGVIGIADVNAALGRREVAMRGYERGVALAVEIGRAEAHAAALRGLGNVRLLLGEGKAALGLLEQALVLKRKAGDVEIQAQVAIDLGRAAVAGGEGGRAAEVLQEARSLLGRGGLPRLRPALLRLEADVARAGGDRKGAARHLRRALAAFDGRDQPELAWRLLRDLADLVDGAGGGAPEARRLRQRARAIVKRTADAIEDVAVRQLYLAEPERRALLEGGETSDVSTIGG